MTNNDLTLTCCIAYDANNQATRHLIATCSHLTSEGFPSLVSLGTNRGVMLQISSFYICYRLIIVIIVSFFVIIVIILCLLSFYDPDSFLLLLSTTDNSYADIDYV